MNPNTSDRSWNDPPVVKYEITGTAKKHHLLKKHGIEVEPKHQEPLPGNSTEIFDPTTKNIPSEYLPSTECEDTSAISNDSTEKSETVLPQSDEENLSFVLKTLLSVLLETADKSEKTTKDVNKRIDIMKESWISNLSEEVKNKMFELAQELEKGNVDAASKIQWSLSVQNVREVKSWMVGVKHIIEMKKESISSVNPNTGFNL